MAFKKQVNSCHYRNIYENIVFKLLDLEFEVIDTVLELGENLVTDYTCQELFASNSI